MQSTGFHLHCNTITRAPDMLSLLHAIQAAENLVAGDSSASWSSNCGGSSQPFGNANLRSPFAAQGGLKLQPPQASSNRLSFFASRAFAQSMEGGAVALRVES